MYKILVFTLFFNSLLFSNDRFIRDDNFEIIFDKKLNLIWQDNNNENLYTYSEAVEYCKELNIGNYNNWRIPRIRELQSIVDYTRYKPAIYIAFKNTNFFDYPVGKVGVDYNTYGTEGVYLSSSKAFFFKSYTGFYYISFTDGTINTTNANKKNYIRCVKDI
ncbi:DUF1566 domain-containing protein [Halarcobacter sp.]|uniref:Lcl C-terminal domain-containing protein n=1 Tax=Halarcobacter sp. TaxID=2321133 RepID=UPI002AA804D1|nr:DUF1566 domain-containing protein [Halarcobacter sp.]